MSILLFIIGSVYLLSAFVTTLSVIAAPVGFEDHNGFHLGPRPWGAAYSPEHDEDGF